MSSSGNHQSDGGDESKQSVIKIDPDGDLTLVVGKTKTRFLVCSKTLSRSAPFWKRCLYGQFKEGKPAAEEDWVVEFPEDNPSGLKCLLLLVHGLGHKMPKINLQLAFEITVLTNKYGMTRTLWAVAGSWLGDLEPTRPDEGGDDTIVPQLKWLWVTKELGDSYQHKETFAELSQVVSTAAGGDAHLLLQPYEMGDADLLTKGTMEGYDAEKDVLLLLAGEIKVARETALSEIQVVLKKDIKRLRDAIRGFDSSKGSEGAYICTQRNSSQQRLCEYAMQAIVTKISAGKDSAVKPIAKIDESVENYLTSAVCFKSRIEREIAFVSSGAHANCTPFRSRLPSLGFLKTMTLKTWRLLNAEAFERQARVSGLEKDSSEDNDDGEDQNAAGLRSAALKRSRDEFEAAASD
ncbi:hypothetical protein INS49_003190 [Diaporthe citri]|uniref:uncharacterized protein n=1 Tax=Diaporthe citri TaxID=83186 RepID=UPI001C80CA56|nr:uncharacterized protein INS49_003190 [Diaporthe citri]KAG6368971.1 hypothetical protein INS49_003190 [Diaporthe citri]